MRFSNRERQCNRDILQRRRFIKWLSPANEEQYGYSDSDCSHSSPRESKQAKHFNCIFKLQSLYFQVRKLKELLRPALVLGKDLSLSLKNSLAEELTEKHFFGKDEPGSYWQ